MVSPQSTVGKDPGKQETTLVFKKKMNKDLVTSQSNLICSWTKKLTSPEQSWWETVQSVMGRPGHRLGMGMVETDKSFLGGSVGHKSRAAQTGGLELSVKPRDGTEFLILLPPAPKW